MPGWLVWQDRAESERFAQGMRLTMRLDEKPAQAHDENLCATRTGEHTHHALSTRALNPGKNSEIGSLTVYGTNTNTNRLCLSPSQGPQLASTSPAAGRVSFPGTCSIQVHYLAVTYSVHDKQPKTKSPGSSRPTCISFARPPFTIATLKYGSSSR